YRKEFDQRTAVIEEMEKKVQIPEFLSDPPLTYDEHLDFSVVPLPGETPLVASKFDSMLSSTIGIALRLDVIAEDKLLYVPLLTEFTTDIGVIKNGKVIDYVEMQETLKQEVLNLSSSFDVNPTTDRVELVLRGDGSNLEESRNALEWIETCLFHPYLDVKNLPRLQDLVNTRLANLRNTMKGREENWVSYPSSSYRRQTNPVFLAAYSFLTQEHFVHRLKWRLQAMPEGAAGEEIDDLFEALKGLLISMDKSSALAFASGFPQEKAPEDEPLKTFWEAHAAAPEQDREIITRAVSDLVSALPDIPEENLSGDVRYLIAQIREDLRYTPEKTVEDISNILSTLRNQSNIRMYLISNGESQKILVPEIKKFVSRLDGDTEPARQQYARNPVVTERLRSRYPGLERPVFVGLVNNSTQNGVFLYNALCTSFKDTDEEKLLDFLASKTYGGGAPHGVFMKTWGAGLAYSNGIGSGEASGRISYYAERCPDLSATMRFVANYLKDAPRDTDLSNYAIAQIFSFNRGPQNYENRGIAIAADLADGITPEAIGAFRQNILKLKNKEDLDKLLNERRDDVYGRILIGLGGKTTTHEGGQYLIIAPEFQFEKLEKYIELTEGAQTVYRIYPRDFWITANHD
ncbi:hypothetical protein ACFLU6_14320, partial [Acidobacteriota bacterium]